MSGLNPDWTAPPQEAGDSKGRNGVLELKSRDNEERKQAHSHIITQPLDVSSKRPLEVSTTDSMSDNPVSVQQGCSELEQALELLPAHAKVAYTQAMDRSADLTEPESDPYMWSLESRSHARSDPSRARERAIRPLLAQTPGLPSLAPLKRPRRPSAVIVLMNHTTKPHLTAGPQTARHRPIIAAYSLVAFCLQHHENMPLRAPLYRTLTQSNPLTRYPHLLLYQLALVPADLYTH